MFARMLGVTILAIVMVNADLAIAKDVWKLATVRRAPDVVAEFDEELARSIGTSTAGDVSVEIQNITNEQEMIQQVVRGRLEMGVTSPLGIAGLMPDIAILNIPYLFVSDAERDHVYSRLVEPLREMFEEKGLVLLAIQEAGYNGVFCTMPCANPAALKGQKVRVSPSASGRMFWSSLGTNPVQLPLSELWPGLEQGLVVAGDLPIGFYSTSPGAAVARHFVYTDHIHSPWLYFVNKSVWDKLPADKRKTVLEKAPATFSTSQRFFTAQEERAKAFADKGGTVYKLTDAQKAAWASLVTPNIEPLIGSMSDRARKIYDTVKTAKAEFAAKTRK